MTDTLTDFVPFTFNLGRLPAVRPNLACFCTYFDGGTLPIAPDKCKWAMKVLYGMDFNGQLGDCVVAGHIHLSQAIAFENGGTYTQPSGPEIKAEYFKLTGGADTGLVESTFLATAKSTPILGSQIDVFCPVEPSNLAEVKSTIYTFGGIFLGVNLPQSAENQFPSDWTVVPGSPIVGGHCIVGIGYDNGGIYIITWGRVIKASWEWFAAYVDEAYAVIYTEEVQKNRGPLKQFDITRLRADIASL